MSQSNVNQVLKGLSKEEKQQAEEAIAKLRASFEDKLANKVTKMVEKQKAKSEFENMVADKRKRIEELQSQRKAMAQEIKSLREEIRTAKSEWKSQ